jgi:hypothetical protein
MRMPALVAVVLCAGGFASVSLTQTHPNFSGKWIVEATGPEARGVMPEQMVRHNATTLTVGHGGDRHAITYTLDGQEHEVTTGNVKSLVRATWEGEKLVIERADTFPTGMSRKLKQVWWLDTSGKLNIELTEIGAAEVSKPVIRVYRKE